MADKAYVSVKCDAKDLFDGKLKAGLIKAMTKTVTDAIDKKSNGKLTTAGSGDEGFVLTATLASLKADDKEKPTKLDAKTTISVITVGSTAKAFNGSSGGSTDGFGSRIQPAAEDLVVTILDDFMPKVIKTMLSL
jgi:hypothetical protein